MKQSNPNILSENKRFFYFCYIFVFMLQCNVGYGGKLCVLDSDNDGWSDSVQSCTDWRCTKVSCVYKTQTMMAGQTLFSPVLTGAGLR